MNLVVRKRRRGRGKRRIMGKKKLIIFSMIVNIYYDTIERI